MAMGNERRPEDWLDFIVDTLKHLDEGARGVFLQEFLLGLVSLEIPENESLSHWEGVVAHQHHLAERLGRPVTLRTAAVDYFGELSILQNPILMEYEELSRLRHNAATDPLTGLNNRRIFEEHLHREIKRATRYGSLFALLALDLRKFKRVNDTYGHAAGDEVLRSVARASLEVIRASDITCRIGGDEFAILLHQAERSSAEALAERIARKFEQYAGAIAPKISVGIDYGIAIFPQDGHDSTTLFANADKALYARKHRPHRRGARGNHPPAGMPPQIAEPVREVETGAGFDDQSPGLLLLPPVSPATIEGEAYASDRAPSARKDERIRLEGSPALGIVKVGEKSWTVRVLDLSRGGVCLLIDQAELTESFPALLQVPLVPGGELTLHRVYSLSLPEGKRRVGCSFAPIA